jgi:hypothetical protein
MEAGMQVVQPRRLTDAYTRIIIIYFADILFTQIEIYNIKTDIKSAVQTQT